jgi:CxxC motif-containing protein
MIRNLICIQCPKSCPLTVDFEGCHLVKVEGNKCPKGADYAKTEIENPLRILTGTVLTEGLALKMLPVRTDNPIPKARILEAATEIKKIRLTKPINIGEVIVSNFMGLGVNLIGTRGSGFA